MFDKRSLKKELMDDLLLDIPALRKNLEEIEATNHWLGSERALIISLEKIYSRFKKEFHQREITLADLGSGSGDLLRAIDPWAKKKNLKLNLIGVDANPFMINLAKEKTEKNQSIDYKQANIFSESFSEMKFDICTLNSFCHHLSDEELMLLLKKLQKQTHFAIIINDLHRHWLPFHTITWLSKLCRFSHLAQHDGPLSVLRAFRKHELINLVHSLSTDYEINWTWPFRWCVIIWCHNFK